MTVLAENSNTDREELIRPSEMINLTKTIAIGELTIREYAVSPIYVSVEGNKIDIAVSDFVTLSTTNDVLNKLVSVLTVEPMTARHKLDQEKAVCIIEVKYGALKKLDFTECRCLSCLTVNKAERLLLLELYADKIIANGSDKRSRVELPYYSINEKLIDHLFGYKVGLDARGLYEPWFTESYGAPITYTKNLGFYLYDEFIMNEMFGDEKMDAVLGSVDGSVRFYGLTPTSMKLEGLDRHQRLIDNYKKLHSARARIVANHN